MQQVADQAPAVLRKDPAHPEKAADQFQMQLLRVPAYEAGKAISDVGDAPDFYQAVAELAKAGVSQSVTLSDNRFAIAVLEGITPSRPSTLEETQNQIRNILVRNRSQAALQKQAQELLDKATTMGDDLEKAAQAIGLGAKISDPVEQSGVVSGLGAVRTLGDALERPEGALFGPTSVGEDTVVGKILQKLPADMSA